MWEVFRNPQGKVKADVGWFQTPSMHLLSSSHCDVNQISLFFSVGPLLWISWADGGELARTVAWPYPKNNAGGLSSFYLKIHLPSSRQVQQQLVVQTCKKVQKLFNLPQRRNGQAHWRLKLTCISFRVFKPADWKWFYQSWHTLTQSNKCLREYFDRGVKCWRNPALPWFLAKSVKSCCIREFWH